MRFTRTYQIRFGHCDMAGIAFYPQYFVLFNDHVEDWFNEGLETDFRAYHQERQLAVPTVRIECDFTAPSRVGDQVEFWLEITRLGTSSVTLARGAQCAGETRVTLDQTLVCFDQRERRPCPWPDALRERMKAYQSDGPTL